ncbi:hypothetical protein P152DRAFT_453887 [Eremomyces bilateralis CBS 781.70]|uniref:Uncharacterized protein n=1 Tax=Eremomyces bilateralis CBS 781.70 TaxID=1392243 RepID=A0A6G1GGW0_9PEZI|nr:uncharacterized protein P152DRAFT_453887 [Eremomyces bilateralis CBS 781.70]KAF1817308.1 hypothetical protein P152DRAFT_453887 [Eremomyces bilateralis CBS 781.70]
MKDRALEALDNHDDPAPVLRLSTELLDHILDFLASDRPRLIELDKRAYLSQESFSHPPPREPDALTTLAAFRLTCRRFSELGAVRQYARVTTRFTVAGFNRLEAIARSPNVAKHVIKFSYMVPYFYVFDSSNPSSELSRSSLATQVDGAGNVFDLGDIATEPFLTRLKEQRNIIDSRRDEYVLRTAMDNFRSLQQIQILRVQDQVDRNLMARLRSAQNGPPLGINGPPNGLNGIHGQTAHPQLNIGLRWAEACSHSTQTIGAALIATKNPCSTLSSPMLSPQSAISLSQYVGEDPTNMSVPEDLGQLLSRLTSLELHFDATDVTSTPDVPNGQPVHFPLDLDAKIEHLSKLFKNFFHAATAMRAIHLGFPSTRPLTIALESVFHNVTWPDLIAFGIQSWKLHSHEIRDFAARHPRLKGLRLRDVLLMRPRQQLDEVVQGSAGITPSYTPSYTPTYEDQFRQRDKQPFDTKSDDTKWEFILQYLRCNMEHLKWCSLRRIDYAHNWDATHRGFDISDPEDDLGTWGNGIFAPNGWMLVSSDDSTDDELTDDDYDNDSYETDDQSNGIDDENSSVHYDTESDPLDEEEHGLSFPTLTTTPDIPHHHAPGPSNAAFLTNHTPLPANDHSSDPQLLSEPNFLSNHHNDYCTCGTKSRSRVDWQDNGLSVDNAQRKVWEKLAVGGCSYHAHAGLGGRVPGI